MNNFLSRVLGRLNLAREKAIKSSLLKQGLGSLGLKVAFTVLRFLTTVIFARSLGGVEFGNYILVMSWVTVLTMLASLGMEKLSTRETAVLIDREEWSYLNGFWHWANYLVIAVSCSVSVIASAIAWGIFGGSNPTLALTFTIGFATVPLMSSGKLRRGTLRGMHYVILAILTDGLIMPALLLLLAVAYHQLSGEGLTAIAVMLIYLAVSVVGVGLEIYFKRRNLPTNYQSLPRKYRISEWRKSILPLTLTSGFAIIYSRADIIMLGIFLSPVEAGIYAVAVRCTLPIQFLLLVVIGTINPRVAKLYASNDTKKLQKLVRITARVTSVTAILLTAGIWLFRVQLLSLFGPEFVIGTTVLSILCVEKLIDVVTGVSISLLHMTGNEGFSTKVSSSTAMLNILLNALLIPQWGISGAAIATTISVASCNIILSFAAYKRVGINPFPI
ncbi:MAG: polysaccharide biosynthesis C-terminal domain-containing protein [Cyanobacteria bacterium P01_H01_bin.15]